MARIVAGSLILVAIGFVLFLVVGEIAIFVTPLLGLSIWLAAALNQPNKE